MTPRACPCSVTTRSPASTPCRARARSRGSGRREPLFEVGPAAQHRDGRADRDDPFRDRAPFQLELRVSDPKILANGPVVVCQQLAHDGEDARGPERLEGGGLEVRHPAGVVDRRGLLWKPVEDRPAENANRSGRRERVAGELAVARARQLDVVLVQDAGPAREGRFERRAERADGTVRGFQPAVAKRLGIDRPAKRGPIATAGEEAHETRDEDRRERAAEHGDHRGRGVPEPVPGHVPVRADEHNPEGENEPAAFFHGGSNT